MTTLDHHPMRHALRTQGLDIRLLHCLHRAVRRNWSRRSDPLLRRQIRRDLDSLQAYAQGSVALIRIALGGPT